MNAGRTTKQGQQVNVGKDHPEYQAIVSTLAMHPEDMRTVGVAPGGTVRVRTPYGEASIAWRIEQGELRIRADVPVGATGVIDLDGGEPEEVGHGVHERVVALTGALDVA